MSKREEALEELDALCPLDGRYRSRVAILRPYFSESALIKYRVRVEVEYLIAISALVQPEGWEALKSADILKQWRKTYLEFSAEDALRCKEIEKTTNHDVKAVEYFLKEKWSEILKEKAEDKDNEYYKLTEFIHFGLTSQDVNHVAQPLALAEFSKDVLIPRMENALQILQAKSIEWASVPMLARTHGQAASPTRMGKEMGVFAYRFKKCLKSLKACEHSAKFGGATGGFNAHYIAYPSQDWLSFAQDFIRKVSNDLLSRQLYTTQIENYDDLAAYCHALIRCNTVLVDLCKDCWQYISLGYFRQIINENEVGSSAMPHKVNPIDFENAEGNLGIANAALNHLAQKLPISRLQRDLSDSTVLRTLGVPLGHTYLAIGSLLKGFSKLAIDHETISNDLDNNWAIVAEAIQTILRREHFPQPYEALKLLTRGKRSITQADFVQFIHGLPNLSSELRAELLAVTPHNYIGHFDSSPFSSLT
mmetsp:Transcript_2952/g.4622  ORF Transcript_2952/g.4622 Transcript_2952/m.4622 type:complete len:478 (-) Transcript_2952:2540-3973(-)